MFLTPAHLFFINKKSNINNKESCPPPIYCRKCGNLFTRDPNKKNFVCKKEKGVYVKVNMKTDYNNTLYIYKH